MEVDESLKDIEKANESFKDIEEDHEPFKDIENETFKYIDAKANYKDAEVNEPFRVSLMNNDSSREIKLVSPSQVNGVSDPSKVAQLKNESLKVTTKVVNNTNGASDSTKVNLQKENLKDTPKVVEPNQIEGVGDLSEVIRYNSANLDDILDDVTLYWVTRTIMSSMRLYAESPILDTLDLLR
uniref:Uncharacterized protein n=1 Tax=Cacopsylla melanoneura TaxID=428564 RepID=A0A8D8X9Z4_9HEMI